MKLNNNEIRTLCKCLNNQIDFLNNWAKEEENVKEQISIMEELEVHKDIYSKLSKVESLDISDLNFGEKYKLCEVLEIELEELKK